MDVFAAIADPARRKLLLQLRDGPARVVDLTASHAVSRPAISRHLRILSDAGLVVAIDRGRERHYRLNPDPLTEIGDLLNALTTSGPPISDRHLDALATEVHRTGRDRRRGTATPTRRSTTSKEQIA